MWWWTKPRCRVSITSRYKLPFLIHFLSASSSSCLPSLSLRKAVEEAMDPGLACITAYVSQDCTGMKDEPAVDKTGDWAQRPGGPCVFRHLFAAVRSELRKAVTVVSLCLLPNKHIHSKTITSYSGLFLTSITWELILKSKTDSYWWCIYLNANFDCFLFPMRICVSSLVSYGQKVKSRNITLSIFNFAILKNIFLRMRY